MILAKTLNGHLSRKQNLDRQWQHTAQFRNCAHVRAKAGEAPSQGLLILGRLVLKKGDSIPCQYPIASNWIQLVILFFSHLKCVLCATLIRKGANHNRVGLKRIWYKNLLCLKLFFCLRHVYIGSVHLAWVATALKCLWIFWRLSSFSHYVNFIQNESFPSNFSEHSSRKIDEPPGKSSTL